MVLSNIKAHEHIRLENARNVRNLVGETSLNGLPNVCSARAVAISVRSKTLCCWPSLNSVCAVCTYTYIVHTMYIGKNYGLPTIWLRTSYVGTTARQHVPCGPIQ